MALNTIKKYISVDLEDNITINRIRMMASSSFSLIITFLQGDKPVDLSDADTVTLVYSNNNDIEETITGSILDAINGQVQINFSPSNTSSYGNFKFYVEIKDITNSVTTTELYGYLTLLKTCGTGL
jgi:hypothetical protein